MRDIWYSLPRVMNSEKFEPQFRLMLRILKIAESDSRHVDSCRTFASHNSETRLEKFGQQSQIKSYEKKKTFSNKLCSCLEELYIYCILIFDPHKNEQSHNLHHLLKMSPVISNKKRCCENYCKSQRMVKTFVEDLKVSLSLNPYSNEPEFGSHSVVLGKSRSKSDISQT